MKSFGIKEAVEQLDSNDKTSYTNGDTPPSVETLENFATLLAEKLNFHPEQWTPIIQNSMASVFWEERKKRYNKEYLHKHTMVYEDECMKLQIMERSSTEVELFWIETGEKCKGLGSDIVNSILDTADELKKNVVVLPVDFDTEWSGMSPINYLRRLRAWYKSFGFKSYSPITPELKYYFEQ